MYRLKRIQNKRVPSSFLITQVACHPSEQIVYDETYARDDVAIPEKLILGPEHQWKDTYHNGYEHNIAINSRIPILSSWLYNAIDPYSNSHTLI